jgi:hypothetical protein
MRKAIDVQRQRQKGFQQAFEGRFPNGIPGIIERNPVPFDERRGEGRLGVWVDKPQAALVDQLDLPKGQGLVVDRVQPSSAADKVGIKPHDILLEVDGKPVSSDNTEFLTMLEGVKSNTPVEVVVLRKGKKETLKGLSLPERKAVTPRPRVENADAQAVPVPQFQAPQVQPNIQFPNVPEVQQFRGFGQGLAGGRGGIMTSTFRSNDRFTTRHQEGTLVITLTGTITEGKSKVTEIHVQDGAVTNKYESLEKVPQQYRDKVKNLIDMNEKSSFKIDIKDQ